MTDEIKRLNFKSADAVRKNKPVKDEVEFEARLEAVRQALND